MIIEVLLVSILLTLCLLYFGKNEDKGLKAIPSPSLLQLKNIFMNSKTFVEASTKLTNLHEVLGPIFKIHIKPFKPFILTLKAEYVEHILLSKDHFERPDFHQVIEPYLGEGIETVRSVEEWKIDRKIVNRAMGQDFHNSMLSRTDCHVSKLCESIKSEFLNKPVDIQKHMHKILLKGILETISASGICLDQKIIDDYGEARNRFFELFMDRLFTIYLIPDIIHKYSKNYTDTQHASKVLTDFAKTLFRQHKLIQDPMNKRSFIQILVDGGMSDHKIIGNINTIIEGGHDTTASAASWIVYELSRNKPVQEKIFREVYKLLGSEPNKEIKLKDIQEMKYVDCFVNEILRYYTTFNLLWRKTGKPVKINNVELPQGTTIAFLTHAMHMSDEYYSNPTVFDPDRFLPENRDKLNPTAYIPFSAGGRNCIAKTIAIHQLKIITAKLVLRFEINSCGHEVDVVAQPMRTSRNGVFVTFTNRNI